VRVWKGSLKSSPESGHSGKRFVFARNRTNDTGNVPEKILIKVRIIFKTPAVFLTEAKAGPGKKLIFSQTPAL
jgi:hypothetical protein